MGKKPNLVNYPVTFEGRWQRRFLTYNGQGSAVLREGSQSLSNMRNGVLMVACQEKFIQALSQTHRALLACAECICETRADSAEIEILQDMCETLALQAKILNDQLLDYHAAQRS